MGDCFRKQRTNPIFSTTPLERYLTNDRGATLAEMMVYLGILMLLMLLLMPVIHTFFKPLDIYTRIRLEREAALFFRHTEIEVNEASKYEIEQEGTQLLLYTEDGELSYSTLGHKMIRKKLNQAHGGHIEMAHFVEECYFSSVNDQLFKISLILEDNGIKYTVERLMGLKVNNEPEVLEEAFVDHE